MDKLVFDNTPLKNLQDLESKIPELLSKKDFLIKYRCPVSQHCSLSECYYALCFTGSIPAFASMDDHAKDSYHYTFDATSNTWKRRNIG